MMPVPPIARVEIQWSENGSVPKRAFASLAAADAALARAFAKEPPPQGGGYNKTAFQVVWVDGQRHEGRADVRAVVVRSSVAAGGILRQHLRTVATWFRDNSATAEWWTPEERTNHAEWGAELLRRLDAEPALGVARNGFTVPDDALLPLGTTDPDPTPTLLPDPAAAVAALEGRFAAVRPAVQVPRSRRTVPATSNRDVRFATNWLSIALAHDIPRLRHATGRPKGLIWDQWRKVLAEVGRRVGDDPETPYPDSVLFWTEHAHGLADAVAASLPSSPARDYGDGWSRV